MFTGVSVRKETGPVKTKGLWKLCRMLMSSFFPTHYTPTKSRTHSNVNWPHYTRPTRPFPGLELITFLIRWLCLTWGHCQSHCELKGGVMYGLCNRPFSLSSLSVELPIDRRVSANMLITLRKTKEVAGLVKRLVFNWLGSHAVTRMQ